MSAIQPQPRPLVTSPDWLAIVREKVETLRFGIVQVVVHDGKVTQIERTERTRLDAPVVDRDNAPRRDRA